MNVAVLGASHKPSRYSYKAVKFLLEKGHRPFPVHPHLTDIEGLKVYPTLAAIELPVDTVTVYLSAANSSRVAEDIGTVQIPHLLEQHWPRVIVEHNFGREFQDNEQLQSYRLVIHCGGCMITAQKLLARIRDLDSIGVPYTNYGLFLAYAQGPEALGKVLRPFGLTG